ncbi:sensor histidine kinase [Motilibacter deserti]|uniref:histidine kinase n=1 Tax=Motilibacter deserti TaxID=2714956 RepID=A0ABX0GRY7_9ACTN|nr:HAMP domain-containing histidine kinase [Motilibacter deserti]
MRARLLAVLLALLAGALVIPCVALGRSLAHNALQAVFLDRSYDVARVVSLAREARTPADAQALAADLARYEQVYSGTIAVVDPDGQVAIGSAPGSRVDPAVVGPALDAALTGRSSSGVGFRWPWDDRPVVVAAPVMDAGDTVGAVVVVAPTDRADAAVLRSWAALAAGALAALVVAVGLALGAARWVLRPVDELDGVAHAIAKGRLDARTPADDGPPELRRLAAAFNEMADHVEAFVEQQRAFVADASHQLRNPLSALLLRIEGLGLELPEDSQEDLEQARDEGRRLTALLDDLLALARAERAVAAPELVALGPLVARRADSWQVVAVGRGLRLGVEAHGDAYAVLDPAAFASALDAVVDNALKFTPTGRAVTLRVGQLGGRAEVAVLDEGPGLAPEEVARATDRFWRSPGHQNVPGSGLGLAIARALLERSGARLSVANRPEGGLVVTLDAPATALPVQELPVQPSPAKAREPAARVRP